MHLPQVKGLSLSWQVSPTQVHAVTAAIQTKKTTVTAQVTKDQTTLTTDQKQYKTLVQQYNTLIKKTCG
jgi:hypothetical protein